MLTNDDELAHELGAAFRAETAGLSYTGRRRPRRAAVVTLPVAAAAIALGAVALGTAPHPAAELAGPPRSAPTSSSSSQAPDSETVTLAGFTLHYQRPAGAASVLRVKLAATGLPAGAKPVSLAGTRARAWVGRDPASGDNALYVQAPDRNGGKLFELFGPGWTQGQLIDLLRNGISARG